MYLDIHSHILHNTDDGANNLNVSISLLENSFRQGITDIIATPHFYPLTHVLEEYTEKVYNNFNELKSAIADKKVPNIYLGFEVLYYSGISRAEALSKLTLNGSKYILLEPDFYSLGNTFQSEILHLKENGLIPIIAHIERYYKSPNYNKFLNFIKENKILTQVNATSFFGKHYNRVLEMLMAEDLITFIASDTHSNTMRPPLITPAIQKIESLGGEKYARKLIKNSQDLFLEITVKEA